MHELYLWPFADAVRAGTASIMCSYNQVNNSYACQNSYLQNYLLKNELGFQGFIMTDWGAHHSGVASALAGLDMSMPGDIGFDSASSYWGTNLTVAVLNGSVPQWRIDDMTTRIVAAWYFVDRENNQVENAPTYSSWTLDTYGYEHDYAMEGYGQVNYHVDVTGDHGANIRVAAARGTVILKNTNGTLPLTGREKLTAVFGSDAGPNTYGPNGCGDRGCDNGTLAMGWGSGTANFPYLITPDTAIQNEVIQNGEGFYESILDDYAYTQMQTLAMRADQVNGVCIAFVNSDSGEGYIVVDGNEGGIHHTKSPEISRANGHRPKQSYIVA
jgi:beta-glucosidase